VKQAKYCNKITMA